MLQRAHCTNLEVVQRRVVDVAEKDTDVFVVCVDIRHRRRVLMVLVVLPVAAPRRHGSHRVNPLPGRLRQLNLRR